MNVLILAAGYATRLYPLTLNKAKPLLVVGGKPIIEWLLDNLVGVPDIETVYIVTNDKFAADFQAWSQSYQNRHAEFKIKVINDGSTSDDDKLGAIGDIDFVVRQANLHETSLLIAAGDNLFTDSLVEFVEYARDTEVTVAVYDVGDAEAIKKAFPVVSLPRDQLEDFLAPFRRRRDQKAALYELFQEYDLGRYDGEKGAMIARCLSEVPDAIHQLLDHVAVAIGEQKP